jgi:hypothetical protein
MPVEDHVQIQARGRESLRSINSEILYLIRQALRSEPAPQEAERK